MLIVIFEDNLAADFHPLTSNKPIYMLRCGATLLIEKIIERVKGRYLLFTRNNLSKITQERVASWGDVIGVNEPEALAYGEDVLIINGRWLFDEKLLQVGEEALAVKGEEIVYAYVKGTDVRELAEKSEDLPNLIERLKTELSSFELDEARLLRYPWDLIEYNRDQLRLDAMRIRNLKTWKEDLNMPGVYLIGDKENILISNTAKIYPCTVLDSSEGPIIIDDDVIIMPHSYIRGPCYIGRESRIVGGRISASSIGPVCRVGGEVEDSIIQGFSNKYHAGFLGHSYVGEWVNLGALTTTSDLKNDYSSVKVPIRGELIDSGKMKIGAFIGDHVKTGIGSLLATGSVIGIMCNLVSSGKPYPKYIPPFTWYVKGRVWDWIDIETMIKSAEKMMARRGARMSDAEKSLYRRLYEETKAEREEFARKLLQR